MGSTSARRRGFQAFLVISTFSFFIEVGLIAYGIWYLFDVGLIIWFSMCIGMLVVPLIGTQLFSLQLWCNREAATFSEVVPHLTMISLPWRYYRLLRSDEITVTKRELRDMYVIRLVYTFGASLPLTLVFSYLVMSSQTEDTFILRGPCVAAAGCSFISSVLTLAIFSQIADCCCVVSSAPPWSYVALRFVWRLGELVARLLTLTLFAAHHGYWIFLVAGLHMLTMGLLLVMDYSLTSSNPSRTRKDQTRGIVTVLLGSYIYLFCHLKLSENTSKAGKALYHIILCMESVALIVLWIIYDEQLSYLHVPLTIVIVIAYLIGLVGALLDSFLLFRNSTSSTPLPQGSANHNVPHTSNDHNAPCKFQCAKCQRVESDPEPPPAAPKNARPQVSCYVQTHLAQGEASTQILDKYLTDCQVNAEHASRLSVAYKNVASPTIIKNKPKKAPRTKHSSFYHASGHRQSTGAATGSNPKRPGSAPVPDIGAFSDQSDLAWDNYDLHLPSTPSVSSRGGRRRSKLVMGVGVKSMTSNSKKEQSLQARDSVRTVQGDQGYFSAISSSSKENSHNESSCTELAHHLHQIPRSYSSLPANSDENASSITSVSARVGYLSCDKCGHNMSLDNLSLYSGQSSTTIASSQYGLAGAEPPWPRDIKPLPRNLPQIHNKLTRKPATCRPIKKKRQMAKLKTRPHSSVPSDTSTSAAYNDCTETE